MRSPTSNRSSRGTSGGGFGARRSYRCARSWRADLERVAEALGGDERDARRASLHDRVGRDRRAVREVGDRRRVGSGALAQHLQGVEEAARDLARRGAGLGDGGTTGAVHVDGVGERAADIDPDSALHELVPGQEPDRPAVAPGAAAGAAGVTGSPGTAQL